MAYNTNESAEEEPFFVYGGFYPIEEFEEEEEEITFTPPRKKPKAKMEEEGIVEIQEAEEKPKVGVPVEEEEEKKGILSKISKWIEQEKKTPKYVKNVAFFFTGILGGFFLPFYPWWMVILLASIVGLIAHKYPQLSLVLLTLFVTAEVAYQSAELGFVFLIASLPLLGASLYDWRYGILTYMMLFLAPYGIPYVVPIGAGIVYTVTFGVTVGVVGSLYIFLFLTLGNFEVFGLIPGPVHDGAKTLVAGHTQPLKDAISNFTLGDFASAYASMASLDNRVFAEGAANLGNAIPSILVIIAWGIAFYIAGLMMKGKAESVDVSYKDWLKYSSAAAALIGGSSAAAMIATNHMDLLGLLLIPGVFAAVYLSTLTAMMIKDEFSGYFAAKAGGVAVGKRVAEMKRKRVTWEMVGGLADVKQEIKESLVVPLLRKDVAKKYGIEPPKGILLFGPPGCGKTLLMKALATELNVEMISVKCSDLMSKWYGESENRVAELFATAKERAPCILFFDEIDAIAKRRDMYSSDDVSPRILTIILSELDGLDVSTGLIVVGTTNKPELVDPALLRPGRMDKVIYVPPPSYEERIDILKVHLMGKPIAPDIDLAEIAKRTERFSGADLANLVKEAAIQAMKRALRTGKPAVITMADFEAVLPNIKPSISLRMIEEYEKIKMDFERKMHQLQRAEKKQVVTWEDVGGLEDIKRVIREYIEIPLKRPDLVEKYKLKTAKGILLFGPPGCGKTHVMRAASHELGLPMQIVNGPELLNSLVGQSEAAIRDIMTRARENAPSIVFFDEIDAIASKESMKTPEVSRAVSQLLTELDGMKPRDKVIVVATTNRPQLLDPALLRPGRFDKIFYVPPPDLKARADIFKIHLKGVPTKGPIDYIVLAHRTEGYSGADIAAIVEEAKLIAIREQVKKELERKGKDTKDLESYLAELEHVGEGEEYGVTMAHLLEALSKIKPSITPETIQWCEEFMEMYGTRT